MGIFQSSPATTTPPPPPPLPPAANPPVYATAEATAAGAAARNRSAMANVRPGGDFGVATPVLAPAPTAAKALTGQ